MVSHIDYIISLYPYINNYYLGTKYRIIFTVSIKKVDKNIYKYRYYRYTRITRVIEERCREKNCWNVNNY